MEDNDILNAVFPGILQGLGTFIAMHHVMVAQQSFYFTCALQFVGRQAGGQETWLGHGIETSGSRKRCMVFFARAPRSVSQESYPGCWSAAVCYYNHI